MINKSETPWQLDLNSNTVEFHPQTENDRTSLYSIINSFTETVSCSIDFISIFTHKFKSWMKNVQSSRIVDECPAEFGLYVLF